MHRIRRRHSRVNGKFVASAVAAGFLLAAASGHVPPTSGHTASTVRPGTAAPSPAAATAIAYARAQLGKPYLWGGTGPDAYDCSGLAQAAWAAAGVSIPRTSQEEFAQGHQVPASQVQPGDLVFFAGSDGTASAPGHVGLVTGPGQMIEAYATGFPIRVSAFGSSAAAPGDETPAGFTDPAWGA